MLVTANLIKTKFNNESEIVHKFTGVRSEVGDLSSNSSVEMKETGLIFSGNNDYYSSDLILGTMTDESAPAFFNDTTLGANHGMPCAITILSKNHNKTIKDVGAIYKDEEGIIFYLVKVLDKNFLVFASKDYSQNKYKFEFVKKVVGKLTYVENGKDTSSIVVENQQSGYLCRSNRYLKKELIAGKDGKEELVVLGKSGCDYAKISEEYLVINPASCVVEIAKNRPKNGYEGIIDIASYGKPLISYKNDYIVQKDGTIIIDFEIKRLDDINWQSQMGIMSQYKKDVYGGGIFRVIPKTKPLIDENGVYDLSTPYALKGKPFPSTKISLTKNFWQDENSPPDRVVDYFKDKNGNDKLCYACGYLPIFDCEISVRAKQVSSAFSIVSSRKVYPTVKDTEMDIVRGVGYKKYFEPVENGISIYSINYENKNYIYADLFKKGSCRYEIKGNIKLLEKSAQIEYRIEKNELIITSNIDGQGQFITFVEEV